MNLRIAAGVKKWPKTGDGVESCTRLILNVAGQATGPIKRPKQTVRKYAST